MKNLLPLVLAAVVLGCGASEKSPPPREASIAWQPWSDAAFATAKRENRLVLLDLGAVWCHWCHVMDRETYGNPEVASEIGAHFVAVHVNQDERPDLANRYEDFGWPATILFAADGTELGKFRGFMPPDRLLSILRAFVADPTPGPSAMGREAAPRSAPAALPRGTDDALHAAWEAAYDRKEQGWGEVHKYLDPDCAELAIDEGRDDLARGTLDAMLGLVDPVWGGVYQYSDGGVWTNPHFEKIMSYQAEDLRIYSLAYRVYGDEKYLKAARDIERYLLAFLKSPDGAFYASQDADLVPGEHGGGFFSLGDAARRSKGIPRVDTHVFARENGWAIAGLASLYRATGDRATLDAAVRAAEWTVAHREAPGGGFRHDETDSAGPFLADTVAMSRAFFELHQTTQNSKWLDLASASLRFIEKTFRASAGYATAAMPAGAEGKPWAPRPQTDENLAVARVAIRIFHATKSAELKSMAVHAMEYMAGLAAEARGIRAAGILLASREIASDPASITVVGDDLDTRTTDLFAAALAASADFSVLRRFKPSESADYPLDSGAPTAYACQDGACSSPIHDAGILLRTVTPARKR